MSTIRKQEGDQAIIGDLHSHMIGYNGEFEAVMETCDRDGAIDEAIPRASRIVNSPIKLSDDYLRRPDYQHFWDAGLPAVLMTDGTKYDYIPGITTPPIQWTR